MSWIQQSVTSDIANELCAKYAMPVLRDTVCFKCCKQKERAFFGVSATNTVMSIGMSKTIVRYIVVQINE